MYLSLALKNLLNQKTRTVLTTLGIGVGVASLALLLSLSEGIKEAVIGKLTNSSPLTQITVQAKGEKGGLLKLLNQGPQNPITPDKKENIEKLPHVTAVYPEMNYANISSLQVSLMGQGLQTDTMIFGVPYEFIKDDLATTYTKEEWDNPKQPYPVFISRKIVDLYNFTVAPTNRLPTFTEKDMSGIEFTLLPNQSTFFPQLGQSTNPVRAKIAGFSDRTSLVGVTLPIEAIHQLNKQNNSNYQDQYLRLFVQVDSVENTESVSKAIQGMNLDVFSSEEEVKAIQDNFKIVTLGLSMISLIILFVSGLMIMNTFLSAVNERKHEIGIYRTLGATQSDIQKMILTEATIIGATASVTGLVVSFIAGFIINGIALNALPVLSSKPETLFITTPLTAIFVLLFGIILCNFFALIPAMKAGNMEPLEALTS